LKILIYFEVLAETESDSQIRAEFENLAASYLRLAEQAERNSHFDVTYEPPPPKIDDPDRSQSDDRLWR
jgi:hypothetical protein